MRRMAAVLLLVALGACASGPRSMHVVPYTLGTPAFPGGDAIELDEIAGTRGRLEVGGVYVVSGHARVVSPDGARLAINSTGTDNGLRTEGYKSVVLPHGESEFHLALAVLAEGDLHITLSPVSDTWSNHPFGGVYFRDPERPFLHGGVQTISVAE